MTALEKLESKSIYLLREAYANFSKLCMLWSIGKDSTVLLHLTRKAFLGKVPFPLIHIDTSFKVPGMIAFRDRLAHELGFTLIVASNQIALSEKKTFPDGASDRTNCCTDLKTNPLKKVIEEKGYTGVIVGIRADEEGTRAKERYFSPRGERNDWKVGFQPPEFWDQFATEVPENTHVRIHPLLDWTELNIWEYIEAEKIQVVPIYFNQGTGKRYRSLGCAPCTLPIESAAKNVSEVIEELKVGKLSKIAERSGRAQDIEDGGGLESLRKKGYM